MWCLLIGVLAGILSVMLPRRWTWPLGIGAVLAVLAVQVWPYLQWSEPGVLRTVTTGIVWLIVPAILAGGIPFILSRFAFRRWAAARGRNAR